MKSARVFFGKIGFWFFGFLGFFLFYFFLEISGIYKNFFTKKSLVDFMSGLYFLVFWVFGFLGFWVLVFWFFGFLVGVLDLENIQNSFPKSAEGSSCRMVKLYSLHNPATH